MKTACFGHELDSDFRGKITDFKKEYENLQSFTQDLTGRPISVSWKIHMVVHIMQFLEDKSHGLARYMQIHFIRDKFD